MSQVQIFVEGVTDQKFIQDILQEWYGIELRLGDLSKPGDIISLGGKDAFDTESKLKKLAPAFQQLAVQEKSALVIFDADVFSANFNRLLPHSKKLAFQFFLLPNNKDDGEIETLLESIINPANQEIFNCWSTFEDCLKDEVTTSTDSGSFTLPARKTKIYAYLETLVGETDSEKEKIKDRNRNYREPRHWNLNHPALLNLKNFLDPFFKTTI